MDHNTFYILFLLATLSFFTKSAFVLTAEIGDQTRVTCLENEREALVEFKQSLEDDNGFLSSWGNADDYKNKECCKWWGVKCSNETGHVIGLDLHMDDWYSSRFDGRSLRGVISHSLSELQHLRYLDLSFNHLYGNGSQLGEVIGSFHRLEYLNLSSNYFGGVVPHQLGNLTSLQTIDLRYSFDSINDVEWLLQLRVLKQLDLTGTYIENASNWVEVIFGLPLLEELQLHACTLDQVEPSSSILRFPNISSPSLSLLDLSHTDLTSSSTYSWLFNVSHNLVSIDLSRNELGGPIPNAFGEMIYLQHINLGYNALQGGIPKSFQNLSHLRSLDLSNNGNMSEPFPEFLQKLSKGAEKSLESLELGVNRFYGPLTGLTRFSSLTTLSLDNNRFSGTILENGMFPPSLVHLDLSYNRINGSLLIGQLPSLVYLGISNNRLIGIHKSIGQLSKLEFFDLSSNVLEGNVSEVHLSGLINLKKLYLSYNLLTLNMSSDWAPSFQLDIIRLANCNMGPHFPKWIRTQNNFSELDLSFAGISDTLPHWFWDLSPKLNYLNLSHNHISNDKSLALSQFHGYPQIDLSSNNFSGSVQSIPPNLTLLNLNKNMFVGNVSFLCVNTGNFIGSLDLSDNFFSGSLPDCWMNMKYLVILNLGNNKFSGQIPESFGLLDQVYTLHLRNNSFVGELPSSLKNCTLLKVIDIGGNKLTGHIPTWIGTHLNNLAILSLRSNKFYGNIPHDICHLPDIQILDLSRNDITGKIPSCLYNFTSLVSKSSSSET